MAVDRPAEYLGDGNVPNRLAIIEAALAMIGLPVGDLLSPIQPLDAGIRRTLAGLSRALGYQTQE